MKSIRTQSRAGNPIRRPPNSGESSGYASSSGYSSASSSVAFEDDDNDDTSSSLRRHYTSSSSSPSNEQVQIARLLLALACFWPLLFLLIPPSTSRSHVALLSTGMVDTMDSQSLSQHIDNDNKRRRRTLHDKIDNLRYKVSNNILAKKDYLRTEMKSLLKRTDVVGYGPSKPRVAIVVVVPPTPTSSSTSQSKDGLFTEEQQEEQLLNSAIKSIESIFRTTDRNRIFVVTVVMDGRGKIGEFESKILDIDDGRTVHRHGNQVHTHDHHLPHGKKKGDGDEKEKEEDHAHSEKIHTIYNHEAMGISASRKEAVQFINILSNKHEEAGLKSLDEELILLFLRCDAQLKEEKGRMSSGRTWLDDVTDALILAPPPEAEDAVLPGMGVSESVKEIRQEDARRRKSKSYHINPANAVSFVVDYSSTDTEGNIEVHASHVGETLSFDEALHPITATASGQDMSLSNGESYPTPLTTVATALRLHTYNSFPASDDMLTNHYSSDLELSFNLWMCADGIDILGNSLARVTVNPLILSSHEKSQLSGPLAARIVSAWMSGHENEVFANRVFNAVAKVSAASWQHIVEANQGQQPKDHTLSDNRELLDKTQEFKHTLVRIASEARLASSFPAGLAKKCRPFSWYVQNVHPNMDLDDEEDGDTTFGLHEVLLHKQPAAKSDAKLLPSNPLSEERMAIISKASPVKLAYEDFSGGHTTHPHMGATDENGVFGYVHDETALHEDPPAFEFKNDDEHERLCKRGDPNYVMLTEKVYVDLTNHEAAERRAEHGLAKRKRVKIFCLVYTIEKFHDRIPAIRQTWGQKCDGFMVASTKTDKRLGTVNIPHEGPEEYNNIWQKVRSMWSYVYDNYYEKYDYFHIGGDDLYLIVENLRLYLESEEIQLASNGGILLPDGSEDTQIPLFMGRRFAENGNRDRMFISGGAGYTLNKAALKMFVQNLPECFPHMHTFSEDVMGATCFRKSGIIPYDTKDEAGGERYMPFQPGHHLTYLPPKNIKDDWYSNYSVDVKWGIDHCAAKSVAFHYIKEDLMKRMHAILYHFC